MRGKRGVINPVVGVTDAAFRAKISSAMRKLWQSTSRAQFIKSVRRPYKGTNGRYKYGVTCNKCDKEIGLSEKVEVTNKSGKKRLTSAYQVDHISQNSSLRDISDVGDYCLTLFFGEMQILCYDCHKGKTLQQAKDRSKK